MGAARLGNGYGWDDLGNLVRCDLPESYKGEGEMMGTVKRPGDRGFIRRAWIPRRALRRSA